MASRAELVMMCQELEIDYEDMSINEMKSSIKDTTDEWFLTKKVKISVKNLSPTLIKFLTHEYDYIITNKEGRKV